MSAPHFVQFAIPYINQESEYQSFCVTLVFSNMPIHSLVQFRAVRILPGYISELLSVLFGYNFALTFQL